MRKLREGRASSAEVLIFELRHVLPFANRQRTLFLVCGAWAYTVANGSEDSSNPLSQHCAVTLARWSSKVLRGPPCRSCTMATSSDFDPTGPRCGWVESEGASETQSLLAQKEICHQLRKPGRVGNVCSDRGAQTFRQSVTMTLREILSKFRSDGAHHEIDVNRNADTRQF